MDTVTAYPNNATIDLGPLPPDSWKAPARTDRTIAAMIAVIHSTDRTGWVRTLAGRIMAGQGRQDTPTRRLVTLYTWFRSFFDFARDPAGVELVRHPDRMIEELERTGRMHGDCDDLACIACALVRAMGLPAVLIVAGRKAQGPFEHVYYGAIVDGRTIPFDPQERQPPGQERPVERRKVYAV